MPSDFIPDLEILQKEITRSHERSRRYGIDPLQTCDPAQIRLTARGLGERRLAIRSFLDVVIAQIKELYGLVAGSGFMMAIVDGEGYLIETIGDAPILEKLAEGNLAPGFRWTEKDVGTSAISLALACELPVQINDREHYCKRGHGYTSSASPVFDTEGKLIGVILMSGDASLVHPHTLGMVVTAARAIEKQLRIIRSAQELLLRNNYMNAIIESIDSGVLAVDREGIITQVNNHGKKILRKKEKLEGLHLDALTGLQVDWEQVIRAGVEYMDREFFIRKANRTIQIMYTAKPIRDAEGRVRGIILIFNEINRIRKLVNEMAGSQARFRFEDIIGSGPAIGEVKKLAVAAASGRSNVLLLGETGTGKELFAQAIHNRSERSEHPFVAINCGAIPRELLESELFGYAEGAFTGARKGGRPGKFELANGGTVLLDEIGDMPRDMQVKLLRVLQSGEIYRVGEHKPIAVDIRIIAATHVNLKEQVLSDNFREDLFYRLNVFPLNIPPLRERSEDIVSLAEHILKRSCRLLDRPLVTLSPEAERILMAHHWPGNIRELENNLERAVNLAADNLITPDCFENLSGAAGRPVAAPPGTSIMAAAERRAIEETLTSAGFNISRASKMLGLSRTTLYKKIKKYNLKKAG